jgi:hypothetical protein
MRRIAPLAAVVAALLASLVAAGGAQASRYIRFGVQDDAWLSYGPGTLASRLDRLDELGTAVVRVTLDWHEVEQRKGIDDWARYDDLLNGLH